MALLLAEAQKLSNNKLLSGIIEEILDLEELFAIFPFTQVNNKAYVYNREDVTSFGDVGTNATTIEGDFYDVSSAASNSTIREASPRFVQVVSTLKILAGDVDIDKFEQTVMTDTNDIRAVQIALRAKGLARTFRKMLALGDSTVSPLQFDGLKSYSANTISGVAANANQTLFANNAAANGGALRLQDLDALIDLIPNGPDVFIMRPGTMRAYRQLLRTTGTGTNAAELMISNFGRPMLTHNGIPIIKNEFLPGNEARGTSTNTASVYAVRLNELDGFHGLFGGPNAGIQVENVGTVQNKDAERIRLKWYVGSALKSTKSLARLAGVTDI